MLAFTPNPKVRAFISLLWGVEAAHAQLTADTDGMTKIVDDYLMEHNLAEKGDLIVMTAGSPPGVAGSTNTVRVHRIGDRDETGAKLPEEREAVRPYADEDHD